MRTTPGARHRTLATRMRPHLITTVVFLSLMLSALLPPMAIDADDEWESTWPTAETTAPARVVVVSPSNPNTIYAATTDAVYRSSDRGTSWSLSSTLSNVTSLTVDPGSSNDVYATFWSESSPDANRPRGIRISNDGGSTWRDPAAGADLIGPAAFVAVAPGDSRVLLVGTAHDSGPGRILRSTDRGTTWNAVYTIDSPMSTGSITSLAFHPFAHNVVYATHDVYHGGVILRSDDAGITWRALKSPDAPLSYPAALALHPKDPSIAYVAYVAPMGAGVRVFVTFNGGGAANTPVQNLPAWSSISDGLPAAGSWQPNLALNGLDPSIVLLSLRGDAPGLYAFGTSSRGWARLSPATAPFDEINSLAYSLEARRVFCATSQGVWQRTVAANVAAPFADYYANHDGWRVLGRAISPLVNSSGLPAQYYEKGRIEDHSLFVTDSNWKFMFGLLVDELQAAKVPLPVGGDTSSVHYSTINTLAGQDRRVTPPPGFTGGIWPNADGSVFIPYSAQLQPTAGHNVPAVFWSYLNRADLFPGGWLHDIGLPMTEPVLATVDKGDVKGRQIWIQAFQRTILTYDPLNPPDWQVERANVGTDYDRALR